MPGMTIYIDPIGHLKSSREPPSAGQGHAGLVRGPPAVNQQEKCIVTREYFHVKRVDFEAQIVLVISGLKISGIFQSIEHLWVTHSSVHVLYSIYSAPIDHYTTYMTVYEPNVMACNS